jgi:hypothetical protein
VSSERIRPVLNPLTEPTSASWECKDNLFHEAGWFDFAAIVGYRCCSMSRRGD